MKKRVYMAAVALIAAGGIFWGCQKDEVLNNPDEGLMLKKATATSVPSVTFNTPVLAYTDDACNECINPDGPYYEQITSNDYSAGPQGSVTIKIYNTETEIIYEIVSTSDICKVTFKDTVLYSGIAHAQPYIITRSIGTFETEWNSCETKTATLSVQRVNSNGVGTGQIVNFDTSYKLVGICEDPVVVNCEESFSYATTDNMHVIFTYLSDVDIPDAEIKLTCPHITDFQVNRVAGVNNDNNPTVLTFEGDIVACVPVIIDITFTPDCDQNNGKSQETKGFANVWTDFKVNEISKKNDGTPNIVYSCK